MGFNTRLTSDMQKIIVKEMGFERSSNSVLTPGLKEAIPEQDKPLNQHDSTKYRALVARSNYLAQDRSDIQFAVKELYRSMAFPTEHDMLKLKRLARYLVNKQRSVTTFKYQGKVERLSVWTDTDYAGCSKTRKSTSGGVAMHGARVLKTWSSTQSVIPLSSGEAEYYGLVKGSAVGLGISSMFLDLGLNL